MTETDGERENVGMFPDDLVLQMYDYKVFKKGGENLCRTWMLLLFTNKCKDDS